MILTPEEYRTHAQECMKEAAAARAKGDMEAAVFWMDSARQYESDAQIVEEGRVDEYSQTTQVHVDESSVPEPEVGVEFEAPSVNEPDVAEPEVAGRIAHSGEIEAAPVQNSDAGYYYFETAHGRWVPTTRADAHARKQNGQQVIEPKVS